MGQSADGEGRCHVIEGLGIKMRLFLVAVAASFPLMVLLVFGAAQRVSEDYDVAQRMALNHAGNVGALIDDYLENLITVMNVVGHSVSFDATDINKNERLFFRVKRDLPAYVNNIKLNAPDGAPLGSSSGFEIDVGDRDYLVNAVDSKSIGFGEPKISRSTGEWTLTVGMALLDSMGDVRGVLSISTRLKELNSLVALSGVPRSALVTVLDQHGHVVTRSHDPEDWISRDLSHLPGVIRAIQRVSGITDGPSADGIQRLGAYSPMRAAPWVVYVGIPNNVAFADANSEVWRGAIAFLASILIGTLAALFFSRMISRPLRDLAQDARNFGLNDLKQRSRVRQGGEIGELATAFNQMAERLSDREQRNAMVEQASPVVIWDRNVQTGEEVWSAGITLIFGYPMEEVGKAATWYRELIHPADLPAYEQSLEAFLSGPLRRREFFYRLRRADQTYAHVEDTVVVARDDRGNPSRLVATVRDISDRVTAEAQLRQAQKLEAVGQLTGGVAHDFNNLLQVVSSSLDILDSPDLPEEERTEMIQQALEAVSHGSDLTRQLLAFSRQQPLQPSVVELDAFVAKLLPLLKRTLGERIEITFSAMPNEHTFINVDRAQLDSAIMNLALNARDAMPNGGHLAFSVKFKQIEEDEESGIDGSLYAMEGLEHGAYCVLEVSDDGEGMSEETQARIFEPFFTTKGLGKGSGLGLPMVFGFMAQSNGKITVYSEPGRGSTFRLYFKAHEAPAVAAADDNLEIPVPTANGMRLLVVEDNDMVRSTVKRQFESLGYAVVEVGNGAEALDVLKNDQDFSLIFSDVVMPGKVDGVALADSVQQNYPHIKILLTSGFPNSERPNHSYSLLSKPYRRRELAKAVHDAIKG
ncbi:ATP-binding protein [Limibacillus halophilus]|uniref:histidine kinase n=1 Tax=Limibacillus halophilus TaxID=1579333 RepID=A0A839SRP6_9PROT|nr:ATP-binding protein [Limibacillus halophilus]MBB3064978.1 PAS domain S-box-containing protein [Limibacillus halophilus]